METVRCGFGSRDKKERIDEGELYIEVFDGEEKRKIGEIWK